MAQVLVHVAQVLVHVAQVLVLVAQVSVLVAQVLVLVAQVSVLVAQVSVLVAQVSVLVAQVSVRSAAAVRTQKTGPAAELLHEKSLDDGQGKWGAGGRGSGRRNSMVAERKAADNSHQSPV